MVAKEKSIPELIAEIRRLILDDPGVIPEKLEELQSESGDATDDESKQIIDLALEISRFAAQRHSQQKKDRVE